MPDLADDPDLKALSDSLPSPSVTAPNSLDNDPDIQALQSGLPDIDAHPSSAPKVAQTKPKVHSPTQFHKAAAPSPTSEPELSWGDVGQQALKNLGPSAGQAAQSVIQAVAHPVKTVQAIGQLGTGLMSQAQGALGQQQDPTQKAQSEALVDALEQHYANAYGSVKGFKKNLATDPVGAAMDASTLLGGAGAGADVAGLAKTAGVLAKASSAIDPVANSIRVAQGVGKLASVPVKAAQAVATGVPQTALNLAAKAGAETDPALRATFLKYYSGQGDATDFAQTAKNALGQIKQDASDAYLAQKGSLKSANPSFQPIDDAIADARKQTQYGGVKGPQFGQANSAIDDVETLVNQWKANPSMQDLPGFDNLKQAIWDVRDGYGNSTAQRHLGGIYNAAKQSIVDADPKYAELMENYQSGLNNINDLTKTLGLQSKAAASTTLAKNLRAMKTGTGSNLLQQLSVKEPALPYMLAGASLNPWSAGKFHTALEAAMAIPLTVMTHNPLTPVGQFVAQSPRIMGGLNYAAGRASQLAQSAAPALKGAYYAGRAQQENEPNTGQGLSPDDIDAATRAVVGEAANQPVEGQAAVAHTILNRAKQSGESLSQVVNRPGAFESVGNGATASISPDSPAYQKARDVVMASLNGELPDLTGGATYFLNKDLQKKLGRDIPKWAQAEGLQIGAHTFYPGDYTAQETRTAHAKGGKVESEEQKVERLVQRLMALVKRAKKEENHRTEPLLNAPDDLMAKALKVAQQGL